MSRFIYLFALFLFSLSILGIAVWDRAYHSMVGSQPSSHNILLARIIFIVGATVSFVVPGLVAIFRKNRTYSKEWVAPVAGVGISILFPVLINFDLISVPLVYAHGDEIGGFLVYLASMTLGAYAAKQLVSFKEWSPGRFSLFTTLYLLSGLTATVIIWAVLYFE
jgi:hypothetical protein